MTRAMPLRLFQKSLASDPKPDQKAEIPDSAWNHTDTQRTLPSDALRLMARNLMSSCERVAQPQHRR